MTGQPDPQKGITVAVKPPFTNLRRILAGVSIAVALSTLAYSIYLYVCYRNQYVVGTGMTPTLKRTDLTKLYLDVKQEQAKSIGQAVLLLAAAVWGLLIAKSDETRIVLGDWPEILMFVCFNAVILAYFVFSYLYTNALASSLYVLANTQEQLGEERVPDFYGTSIESLNQFTFWLFVAALVVAGFTFFSAHRLK